MNLLITVLENQTISNPLNKRGIIVRYSANFIYLFLAETYKEICDKDKRYSSLKRCLKLLRKHVPVDTSLIVVSDITCKEKQLITRIYPSSEFKLSYSHTNLLSVAVCSNLYNVFDGNSLKKLDEISMILSKSATKKKEIFPEIYNIFKALDLLRPLDTKVIILGQDPYHSSSDQAMGLAFSVKKGVKHPPSLRNIFKELKTSGFSAPDPLGKNGDLTKWNKPDVGVLLLNTALTVEQKNANVHSKIWQPITHVILDAYLSQNPEIIGILWGKHAQRYFDIFDKYNAVTLQSAHPSPLSAFRGFFGSDPFSQVNQILQKRGTKEVDWNL